jgi:hypothetical protein
MLPHSKRFGQNVARPRRSMRRRPDLEPLEDRRLLATFSPSASAADGSSNSLRAAIILANTNGQDNTINLTQGVYQLSIANGFEQENSAATGDLDLTDAGHSLTIQGAGAGVTIIDGGALDRVFQVLPGVNAAIRNLTIQNGLAQDDGSNGAVLDLTPADGGGILNQGTLELDGVAIENCRAVGGNGLSNASTDGAAYGERASGGAIANDGTMTLNSCLISGNVAQGGAGGDIGGAEATAGSAVGGGIENDGTLTITQSAIVLNKAVGGAGGNGGRAEFGTGIDGGDGGNASGGGIYGDLDASDTRVVDSTIAANDAIGGSGGAGGPGSTVGSIGLNGGRGGDAGGAVGGGVAAVSDLSLFNCTIALNQAQHGTPGNGGPGGFGFPLHGNPGAPGVARVDDGGGIVVARGDSAIPYLTSISTIIAQNITSTGIDPDAYATFSYVFDTLVGVAGGAMGIAEGINGNFVGVDPKLGPLQNNGGPTPTVALLSGSLAINNGSNPLSLTADQRGYTPRAAGGAPDIGAFEVGASAPSSGGGGVKPLKIAVKTVNVNGSREIEVFNAGTKVMRFAVFPFGKSYRGTFQVTERDVDHDGVLDVIAHRRAGTKLITEIFDGLDGSQLPS